MTVSSAVAKKRPKHLELWKIRLPVPGIVSILHRISGALLFLVAIPVLLTVLDRSLASQESFEDLRFQFSSPFARLVVLGLAWAFAHHFLAGLRYLLLDLHVGIELQATRRNSMLVLVASGVLTFLVAVALW